MVGKMMNEKNRGQLMKICGDYQGLPGKTPPHVAESAGGSKGLCSEGGQAIVIITVAMIVFIALLGLALDLGVIFVRRVQLSRAVDAAALAAVTELPNLEAAETVATEFFHANGFPNVDPAVIAGAGTLTTTNCLTVTATLTQSLFFMPIFGYDEALIPALAVAEYKSPVEMFVSQTGESGVEGVVNLSVFGPNTWTNYGDAFTPLYSDDPGTPNPYRDEMDGKYTFRILIPPGFDDDHPRLFVEILDPDCYNRPNPPGDPPEVEVRLVGGGTATRALPSDSRDRKNGCLIPTGDPANEYWFWRMDENREPFGNSNSYTAAYNTTTRYTLYYEDAEGSRHDLATYTKGGAESDADTDLKWTLPAGFNPCVDADSTNCSYCCPDIAVAENGARSLFLEVEAIDGSSENGFDIWAGPQRALPKNVNERNVMLLENPELQSSGGVVVTAIGYLPLNVNTDTTFTVTLAYIPPEKAGVYIKVSNFDNDCPCGSACEAEQDAPRCVSGWGCRGLDFYLEGVPDFHEYGIISRGNKWGENIFQIPDNFFGGYLRAVYLTSQTDTSSWRAEYLEGGGFVRLIK